LWAFNEEVVARAIVESALPVVSAVGHEIDYTIADFVADVRAATPSVAAEIITEGFFASRETVVSALQAVQRCARQAVELEREAFENLGQRLARAHPRRRIGEQAQRLDELATALSRCVSQAAREQRTTWRHLAGRLRQVRPGRLIKQQRERLRVAAHQLQERGRHQFQAAATRFATVDVRLRLLGPEQVLARGYSITMDATTGEILREARRVKPGQRLRTRLKSGEITSRAGE